MKPLYPPMSALRETISQRLIDFLGALPITEDASVVYDQIRSKLRTKDTRIGPNDLWLAAQAKAQGLVMVTRNGREFKRMAGLKIEELDKK